MSSRLFSGIYLWERRCRRWLRGKDTRVQILRGAGSVKKAVSLLQKGIVTVNEISSMGRIVTVRIGKEEPKPHTLSSVIASTSPVLPPGRYLWALAGMLDSNKKRVFVKQLLRLGISRPIGRRGSTHSAKKVGESLRSIFERGRLPKGCHYMSYRTAEYVFWPIAELLVDDLGGKPTAFLLKRFRYVHRE